MGTVCALLSYFLFALKILNNSAVLFRPLSSNTVNLSLHVLCFLTGPGAGVLQHGLHVLRLVTQPAHPPGREAAEADRAAYRLRAGRLPPGARGVPALRHFFRITLQRLPHQVCG